MFSDDAKAVIALATRLGDSKRPALSPGKWYRFATLLADAGRTPGDVFDPTFAVTGLPGMRDDIARTIAELVADASRATMAAADLGQMGIWTITVADEDYPNCLQQRLSTNAAPAIFGIGNRSLLTGTGIGIVGSRNVTAEAAEAAQALARRAVQLGRVVVSGGARGVDQIAMSAAHDGGGDVVGVLADSLQARIRRSDVLEALDTGGTCLISQQIPSAGFTPVAAMARNKLIYALSAVTVVVASDLETGGTWSGATEALKHDFGSVAVWRGPGEGAGNEALERAGAVPVTSAVEIDVPTATEQPPSPEQLSLADTL